MKKKQVLAVSSALMIGTTTALTGLPTPVMAQENTEVVQKAIVEENKTEQVSVEQETENAEVQENTTDKEQEKTAENAETLKEDLTEESTKQETPATPEKEVVTEDKTGEENKNTEVKAGSIAIDEAHFPDTMFREDIKRQVDKDNNNVLSEEEISNTIQLKISKEVVNASGIENFHNLKRLKVGTGLGEPSGKLASLDVSKNTSLELLQCGTSALRNLTLGNLPNLKDLSVAFAPISTLDVTKYPNLEVLDLTSTKITNIDLSNNTNLKSLWWYNGNVKNIDLSSNVNLYNLRLTGSPIENIDLSNNLNLETLEISDTKIPGLDLSKHSALKTLTCLGTSLTWLNIGNNTQLSVNSSPVSLSQEINITGNSFNLKEKLNEDIDISKIVDVYNGTLDKNTGIITVENPKYPITYTYDCGISKNNNPELLTVKFNVRSETVENESTITITGNLDTIYTGNPVSNPKVTSTGSTGNVTFTWEKKTNNTWEKISTAPVNAGTYRVTAHLASDGTYNEATSTPVIFTISKATPKYEVPTDLTAVVGDTLADVKLPKGFSWQVPNSTSVGNVGQNSFKVTYTPDDTENYNIVKDINVIIDVTSSIVDINDTPIISASDVTLNVGDTFNPLANVTATDKEDGTITLTEDNIVANDVDTSKVGTYHVTYKVTDKNGASTEKTITVIVKQNTGDLNSAPTISANDITLNVGDTFDPLANITATDKEDGTIALTKDNIIANDVDTFKAGTYHVTYKVTDKNGASTEKTITVIVKQNTGDLNSVPTISANDITLNVGDTFNPLVNITATDKEDGTITLTKDNIIANDVDTSKAGTYHVTYKITDKNGASTEKTITVTVKEKTTNKPVSPQQPQKPNKPTTSTKPSGQKNPVKTGDVTNVGLFASMFAGSTGALAVLFGKKRKRNKND